MRLGWRSGCAATSQARCSIFMSCSPCALHDTTRLTTRPTILIMLAIDSHMRHLSVLSGKMACDKMQFWAALAHVCKASCSSQRQRQVGQRYCMVTI